MAFCCCIWDVSNKIPKNPNQPTRKGTSLFVFKSHQTFLNQQRCLVAFCCCWMSFLFPHQPNVAARFKIIAQALLAWGWDELLGLFCWDFSPAKENRNHQRNNHDGKMGSVFFQGKVILDIIFVGFSHFLCETLEHIF